MLIAAWVSYCWRLLVTGLSFIVFGMGGLLVPLLATPVLYLETTEQVVSYFQRAIRYVFRGKG